MALLTLMQYWVKSWLIKNWLANKSIKEIEKKYKENLRLQKSYYVVQGKQKKWLPLSTKDIWDRFKFNDIIW